MSRADSAPSRGRGLFVTGTDTGVGKTEVSLALMACLKASGLSVIGMKPVSAGCEHTPEGWRNADAVALMQESSLRQPYERVNPFAFEPPIAPHIAAADIGVRIDLSTIERAYHALARSADVCVVEGAGGWLVPLNERETFADLAARLGLPVVLVVGIRLGCLNHALLSVESIAGSGAALAGWVANGLAPDTPRAAENIAALEERIPVPRLATVRFRAGASRAHFSDAISGPALRSLIGAHLTAVQPDGSGVTS